jgi:YihY family inner membrane protein
MTMPWHVADRRRWGRAILQTALDLRRSNVVEWSAVLAFYALISAFPLLLLGMLAVSWVADPVWAAGKATALLGSYLPHGQEQIEEIVQDAISQRYRVGLISAAVLVVTGRRVLGALTKALNAVSDVDARDDPLRRRVAVEAALLAGLVIALLLALASRPLLQAAWDVLGLVPGPDGRAFQAVQLVVRVALLLVVFTLVYVVVPRGERFWRAAFMGAMVATALFVAAQGVFALVLDTLWANLSLIYGPLAFATLLLTWAWYIAFITLIGGALASHVKVMILEGRPAGDAARAHVR